MARMKDIVIKLQNGEELTPDEMAVVVESGVDIKSYMTEQPGVGAIAYGNSETIKKIAEKTSF